jgi:hypothetical protein
MFCGLIKSAVIWNLLLVIFFRMGWLKIPTPETVALRAQSGVL